MRRDARFGSALISHVIGHGLEPFLESTRTLVALLDRDGQPLAGNPAFELLYGAQASSGSVLRLIAPDQRDAGRRLLESAVRDQRAARGKLELGMTSKFVTYDCLIVPAGQDAILLFAEPVHADADLLSAYEGVAAELDATRLALSEKTAELQAVVAQADEMASTDSLTGLPNHRAIIGDLQRQVTYAERYGTPLAISMLDLDGFKAVNDGSGHPAGDKILGTIARQLRERIRQPDEIGRYGGDEFLVVLPNSTAHAASEQASRLCQRVRSTVIPFGESSVRLTLSAGIAQFTPGVDNWQSLLERADRALYEAKRLGGDRWLILES